MSQIHGSNNETITIPFPKEKYVYQLKRVGVSGETELTFSKLVQLMTNSIGDFKNGSMSLDELSEMFDHLYWKGFFRNQPESKQDRFSEIGNVLESGAELSYYLRHAADEGEPNMTFIEFFSEIMRFYDKRATVQANVDEIEKQGK